jgi:membrane protease YdiL (CAAX protease family)
MEIFICLIALLALGERRLGRALAVDRSLPRGFAFGVVCTLPMLIGFALVRGSNVKDALAVVYLAFWSPFIEEAVTRGFAFRAIRRLGWPLWPAAAACAMVTGLAHIEKGQSAPAILGLFAFTGIGGAMFCWLVERWDSLWFPWALHALMNFWWEVFNVAPTALGGWYAFLLQNGSILLAILITRKLTKARPPRTLQLLADDRLGDRGKLHVRRALIDLAHF